MRNLRPLFDQVVIKELEPDRVRQSGLVVPPGTREPPPQHGIVIAVGPGLDWWEQAGVKMPVAPGDHVVFPASAGVWVEVEEERLLVCSRQRAPRRPRGARHLPLLRGQGPPRRRLLPGLRADGRADRH